MLMIVLDFGSLHIFQWRNRLRSCHLINQRNGYVINTTCKNKNKKTIRKYFYIKYIYIYASNILTSKMDLVLIMGWWQVEQDIFLVLWSYFWIIFKVVHAERPAELGKSSNMAEKILVQHAFNIFQVPEFFTSLNKLVIWVTIEKYI